MRQWAFNILAILTVPLLIAIAIFWVRSHRHPESLLFTVSLPLEEHVYVISTFDGCLFLAREKSAPQGRPQGFQHSHFEYGEMYRFNMRIDSPQAWWRKWGFGCQTIDGDNDRPWDHGYTALMMPFWSAFLLVLMPMLPWGVGLWRRRQARTRDQPGLCRACGYDLRASKTRCPECGTPIP